MGFHEGDPLSREVSKFLHARKDSLCVFRREKQILEILVEFFSERLRPLAAPPNGTEMIKQVHFCGMQQIQWKRSVETQRHLVHRLRQLLRKHCCKHSFHQVIWLPVRHQRLVSV